MNDEHNADEDDDKQIKEMLAKLFGGDGNNGPRVIRRHVVGGDELLKKLSELTDNDSGDDSDEEDLKLQIVQQIGVHRHATATTICQCVVLVVAMLGVVWTANNGVDTFDWVAIAALILAPLLYIWYTASRNLSLIASNSED